MATESAHWRIMGKTMSPPFLWCFYAPNFKEIDGAYWFRVPACVYPSVHASIHSSKTVHARVLTFHIWIPHSWPIFFFLSELSPFLELCPFGKTEWNLVSKISRKVFELGPETWSADKGWWVDYLIKFKKNSLYFFQSYGPFKIWAF